MTLCERVKKSREQTCIAFKYQVIFYLSLNRFFGYRLTLDFRFFECTVLKEGRFSVYQMRDEVQISMRE